MESAAEVEQPALDGERTPVVVSLSNNAASGHTANRSAAEANARRFQESLGRGGVPAKRSAEAIVSLGWIAGIGLNDAIAAARAMVDEEMKKGVKHDVNDYIKLELALNALRAKKYSLAEYFLNVVRESKNVRVKAISYNLLGVIAMNDERLVEAVTAWEKSIQALPSHAPALLNLGYVAMRYGDSKTAIATLGQLPDDWFAQAGLISAHRLAGNPKVVEQLCERVLGRQPSHKASLVNCGLHEWQTAKDYRKARELLARAAKVSGGEAGVDERIYQMVTELEADQARERAAAPPSPSPESRKTKDKGK
jgi:tetratricopeptide (TPR) repeat protein